MKRSIYGLLVAVFVSCTIASGQNSDSNTNNRNGEDSKKVKENTLVQLHIDRLKADVELTAEQEKEIRRLLEKLYKDREKSAEKADQREQIKSKKQDYEAYLVALNRILTEEQRAVSAKKSEDRKQSRKNRTNANTNEQ
jgi:hypothetical protein